LKASDLDRFKASPVALGYPETIRTFYSPQDDVHGVLTALLAGCQSSLVIAMYGYDDDELAGMVAEHLDNDQIHCQITLDKSQAGGAHERALLEKYKAEMDSNSVAIGTSEKGAIMHRKMLILDGVVRVSGSTNWSESGESKQDNELTVVFDATVAAEARRILDLEHVKALTQMEKSK
jgi:phosphatidylserine/phosphatidylglycerophosphate/cardiolipin synthase-like enzyme